MSEDIDDPFPTKSFFIPPLEDFLAERGDRIEDLNEFFFSVNAPDESGAELVAKRQLHEAFGVNPDDVVVTSISEIMSLDIDENDPDCSGPINRFETVCWVPRTPLKWKVTTRSNDEGKRMMEEIYEEYKPLAGKIKKIRGKAVRFPSISKSGFKCALNRTIELCNLGMEKKTTGPRMRYYKIVTDNPLKRSI